MKIQCKIKKCWMTAQKDKKAYAKAAQEHDAAMKKYIEYEKTTMTTPEYGQKLEVCMSSYVLRQPASDQFLFTTGITSTEVRVNGSWPERCQRCEGEGACCRSDLRPV